MSAPPCLPRAPPCPPAQQVVRGAGVRAEAEKLERRKKSLQDGLASADVLARLQREQIDRYLIENRLRDTRSILKQGDVGDVGEVRTELARHIKSIIVLLVFSENQGEVPNGVRGPDRPVSGATVGPTPTGWPRR